MKRIITRQKAHELVANHTGASVEIVSNYTDAELIAALEKVPTDGLKYTINTKRRIIDRAYANAIVAEHTKMRIEEVRSLTNDEVREVLASMPPQGEYRLTIKGK